MKRNTTLKTPGMDVRSHTILIFTSILFVLLIVWCPLLFALDPAGIKEPAPPIVTEESVIFSFKGMQGGVRAVMVNGDFNRWEEPLSMEKNRNDVFILVYDKKREKSVVVEEGQYAYRYLVDGVWMKDPYNEKVIYDRYGTELSVFTVNVPIIVADGNPIRYKHNEYVFYYRNRNAKSVSIVGDFNNWNPYSHPMRKNRSGLWEVTLDIPPGSYLYRFVVDGVFKTDPLNRNFVKDNFDNAFSQLQIPMER
jgi:hypothetical protein